MFSHPVQEQQQASQSASHLRSTAADAFAVERTGIGAELSERLRKSLVNINPDVNDVHQRAQVSHISSHLGLVGTQTVKRHPAKKRQGNKQGMCVSFFTCPKQTCV